MRRPNILMITCHDIGHHLGCYGVNSVQTGNLDKLASRGVRFANFYSTSAVCSPGRGSLRNLGQVGRPVGKKARIGAPAAPQAERS